MSAIKILKQNLIIKLTSIVSIVALMFSMPTVVMAAEASTITLNSTIANSSTVAYNSPVTITGQITPIHQATVYVQSKKRGNTAFKNLVASTSDASGNFSVTFNARSSGTYRIKWNGDSDHLTATSSELIIFVQGTVTLSNNPKPTWAGQEFYIKGSVSPEHVNKNVSVQEIKNGAWKTIVKGKTDKYSKFNIKTSLETIGSHRLRVAFSDTDHELGTSEGLSMNLKWGNPWKISAKYANYLVVNKGTFKLWYLRKGRIVKTFRAGVGQPKYPTPSGNFKIVSKAVRPTWHRPSSDWAKDMPETIAWPNSPMGARGLYTSASGIIVHGTLQPWLLDRSYRAVSHGCIRLKNEWVSWLYNRIPVGTPIKIY